jgi:hypothetical protein
VDKVLAFVRTGIISRQYSDSVHLLDTFNAANNLPDVLFALISGGALAMAFIPLLTEYLTRKTVMPGICSCCNVAFCDWPLPSHRLFCPTDCGCKLVSRQALGRNKTLLAELMRLNLAARISFDQRSDGFTQATTFYFFRHGPSMYNLDRFGAFLVPRWGSRTIYGVIIGAACTWLIPRLVRSR